MDKRRNHLDCFRPQRYKILKPIHNRCFWHQSIQGTVSDHKDTKFWNQFTTSPNDTFFYWNCFRPQRYKILKPIHNGFLITMIVVVTVSDHKDTKFWNQFTTGVCKNYNILKLFQTTKIQNFETNSQQVSRKKWHFLTVSDHKDTKFWNQFTTDFPLFPQLLYCFRPQRYKILKPIHNNTNLAIILWMTVSDHKDTKFWNQFTTVFCKLVMKNLLFQTTKIQNFETNSQQLFPIFLGYYTVSDHKDTKFWNQFTTGGSLM